MFNVTMTSSTLKVTVVSWKWSTEWVTRLRCTQ